MKLSSPMQYALPVLSATPARLRTTKRTRSILPPPCCAPCATATESAVLISATRSGARVRRWAGRPVTGVGWLPWIQSLRRRPHAGLLLQQRPHSSQPLRAAQIMSGMEDLIVAGGTEMMSLIAARTQQEMGAGLMPSGWGPTMPGYTCAIYSGTRDSGTTVRAPMPRQRKPRRAFGLSSSIRFA